jgi:hypothetical protein
MRSSNYFRRKAARADRSSIRNFPARAVCSLCFAAVNVLAPGACPVLHYPTSRACQTRSESGSRVTESVGDP